MCRRKEYVRYFEQLFYITYVYVCHCVSRVITSYVRIC